MSWRTQEQREEVMEVWPEVMNRLKGRWNKDRFKDGRKYERKSGTEEVETLMSGRINLMMIVLNFIKKNKK